MTLGLLLVFCSKYSVGLASSENNSSAAGAAAELGWLPAAQAGGYWCAGLLVLLLATCAARSRRRSSRGSVGSAAGRRRGLCDRLSHCWPWAPNVTDSPLASQVHLGRASLIPARHNLRFEQLVENCYVHSRPVTLDLLYEGRVQEITDQATVAAIDDQEVSNAGDGGVQESASGEAEEILERVSVDAVRKSLRLQEARSEPLLVLEPEDRLYTLEEHIIPITVKEEGSSPGDTSEAESPPPLDSAEDRELSVYASKQSTVKFNDKLRSKKMDGAGSSTSAEFADKKGDQTSPCPLHSIGGPLSSRPSAKSLASIRDGDVLDQEVDYSDKLCTCPPSQKDTPRLVAVSSRTSQRPEEEEQRQVEVVRVLSRFSSFSPEDEKDAIPKDPLTIPQAWVPIQEQAAFSRSATSIDGTRLAETLSEIASKESRTSPDRQPRSAEPVTSRRGVKRSRNERDDDYVSPVLRRKPHTKSREVARGTSHSRRNIKSVAAQTGKSSSPPARRIVFADSGTQANYTQVHTLTLDKDSSEVFGAAHRKTEEEGSQELPRESVISEEDVAGDRIPSSCFLHDIVPALHKGQQKKKKTTILNSEEVYETADFQYLAEPMLTIAPAIVSAADEAFYGPSNVSSTRVRAEHPDENCAAEVESGLSTQWDLLHNFPSSSVSPRASGNESAPYVTRNTPAFDYGADVICESRPHSACSTVTEQMLQRGARYNLREPAETPPESVKLLYNRKGNYAFTDSSPGTPKSQPEEFTVYLKCQCGDAVSDYEQDKSFESDERLLYGLQPEREHSPAGRRADSWRTTPVYQPASPTVMETATAQPIAQQQPTIASPALTGDQQTMLHWRIIVHPQKDDDEGNALVAERGPPKRANKDAEGRQ